MVGLIWGGGVYAWSSPTIIACLVGEREAAINIAPKLTIPSSSSVGASFFVILAGHQTKIKTDGLMSSALFENSNFLTCLLSIFVEGLIYNVFTVSILSSLLEVPLTDDPLITQHFYGNETGLLWDARPYFLALRYDYAYLS